MTRQRKRSNDPAALRARILDVASAAFQAGGYHSTSTDDIIRAAGVTGGALHHHFPTKKSLGLAVIKERVAPTVAETWIAPVRAGRTAVDGILDAFEGIAGSLDERGKVLGCPLNNLALELSLTDPEFQSAVSEIFETWRKAISDKIRTERTTAAKSMKANEVGAFVVASYSGAIAMAKVQQTSEPLRMCARQLATLFGGRQRGRLRQSRNRRSR